MHIDWRTETQETKTSTKHRRLVGGGRGCPQNTTSRVLEDLRDGINRTHARTRHTIYVSCTITCSSIVATATGMRPSRPPPPPYMRLVTGCMFIQVKMRLNLHLESRQPRGSSGRRFAIGNGPGKATIDRGANQLFNIPRRHRNSHLRFLLGGEGGEREGSPCGSTLDPVRRETYYLLDIKALLLCHLRSSLAGGRAHRAKFPVASAERSTGKGSRKAKAVTGL